MTAKIIKIPWSQELIDSLNRYQRRGDFHEYTCGYEDCRTILEVTENGFVCPKCGYIQNWCHDIDHNKFTNTIKKSETQFKIKNDDGSTYHFDYFRIKNLEKSLDILEIIQCLSSSKNIYAYNFSSAAIASIKGLFTLMKEVNSFEDTTEMLTNIREKIDGEKKNTDL